MEPGRKAGEVDADDGAAQGAEDQLALHADVEDAALAGQSHGQAGETDGDRLVQDIDDLGGTAEGAHRQRLQHQDGVVPGEQQDHAEDQDRDGEEEHGGQGTDQQMVVLWFFEGRLFHAVTSSSPDVINFPI